MAADELTGTETVDARAVTENAILKTGSVYNWT